MMPNLRIDLLGSQRQTVRIDQLEWTDGPERGSRLLRLVNGGGLEVEVLPDRGFDIGRVTMNGTALAWLSPTGFAAPGLAEHRDEGWLRTFGGGLLSTCGMDTFGDPSTDAAGQHHPQHGRYGTQPGRLLRADIIDGALVVEAEITQAAVHGEHLVIRRTLRSPMSSNELTVTDTIENRSDRPQAHMVLYHVNLGWPTIAPNAIITTPARRVDPANEEATTAANRTGEQWNSLSEPTSDAGSLVYLHTLPEKEVVTAAARNDETGAGLELRFDTAQLPWMHSWKVLRHRQYVLGLEPANSPTMTGRSDAEAAGTLPLLAAGETRSYQLHFSFYS